LWDTTAASGASHYIQQTCGYGWIVINDPGGVQTNQNNKSNEQERREKRGT